MSVRERYRNKNPSLQLDSKSVTKNAIASDVTLDGSDGSTVAPVDYLFHSNTTTIIKEAIEKVIQNRPEDPISFLTNYFAVSPVTSSPSASSVPFALCDLCEKLYWCHYTQEAYQNNILDVYNTLSKTSYSGGRRKGLVGEQYNEVLITVTKRLPEDISHLCLEKLCTKELRVITFTRFYHDVLLIHVLDDYVQIANELFDDFDVQRIGKLNKHLCTNILKLLEKNVKFKRSIELNELLEKTHIGDTKAKTNDHMNKSDFLRNAVEIFLEIA